MKAFEAGEKGVGGREKLFQKASPSPPQSSVCLPYSSGTLGCIVQMPQGQTPEQMPHPMHRSGSETYRYAPPASVSRLMAPSGQDSKHILQSRQVPQLTQRSKSRFAAGSSP